MSGDVEEDSVEVIAVVPAIVAGVVVMVVRVVGLWGAALPSVALVLSVSGTGFCLSGWSVVCGWFNGSLFLRLFLLPWLHREGCKGRG